MKDHTYRFEKITKINTMVDEKLTVNDLVKMAKTMNTTPTIANSTGLNIRDVAVKIALSYEGQKEVPAGSNWGKFVQDCLKTVGIHYPAAWCVSFTYRCYQEAANELGVFTTHPRTAGVLKCMQMAGKDRQIPKAQATDKNILSGYLGIMDYGKGLGHIYIVVSVEGDKVHTIEGNTDASGSRTGGSVCRRVRSLKDAKLRCFIKM